jgi:hypothetical protein
LNACSGKTVVVIQGALFPADHPAVKEQPALFEPAKAAAA